MDEFDDSLANWIYFSGDRRDLFPGYNPNMPESSTLHPYKFPQEAFNHLKENPSSISSMHIVFGCLPSQNSMHFAPWIEFNRGIASQRRFRLEPAALNSTVIRHTFVQRYIQDLNYRMASSEAFQSTIMSNTCNAPELFNSSSDTEDLVDTPMIQEDRTVLIESGLLDRMEQTKEINILLASIPNNIKKAVFQQYIDAIDRTAPSDRLKYWRERIQGKLTKVGTWPEMATIIQLVKDNPPKDNEPKVDLGFIPIPPGISLETDNATYFNFSCPCPPACEIC